MAKELESQGGITYLKINGEGTLYESSATPKEGYTKVDLKEGKVTYHKFYKSTSDGHLSRIEIKDSKFGKTVNFSIKSEDGIDVIQIPLKVKESIGDYVKSLAMVLNDLDFSQRISVSPSRKKNDKGFLYRDFYFNLTDAPKTDKGFSPFVKTSLQWGTDVPKATKTQDIDGTDKWSTAETDKYIYNLLMEQIKRFEEFQNTNKTSDSTPVTNESKEQPTAAPTLVNKGEEPLPF